LGIFIDNKLNWHPHIEYISSKLSRVIYLIKRLTLCVPTQCLRTAYFAYFQSVLRYGLFLFGNCVKINEIIILQKKVVRLMTKSDVRAHCRPLFKQFEIQTVINLYIFYLVLFILKNQSLVIRNREIHSYNTRNKDKATIEFNRLSRSLSSHLVLSLKVIRSIRCIISLENTQIRFLRKSFMSGCTKIPSIQLTNFLLSAKLNFKTL
jgi:hypothetical protein